MWQHTGSRRPAFAQEPGPGQESVWDYPRPPLMVPDSRLVVVRSGNRLIAETRRAVRVLETASPPTFYVSPDDVHGEWLQSADGESFCEWKGRAEYWSIVCEDGHRLDRVAWSYPEPNVAFVAITGWLSFYPGALECTVDGERVRPQPGGFYGGWLTDEIVGPVKGGPGSSGW